MQTNHSARQAGTTHTRPALRFSFPLLWRLGLAAGILAFLVSRAHPHITNLDWTAVLAAVRAQGAGHWGLALAATAASFWAIGRYDAAILSLSGSAIDPRRARRSGMAAIALSQTLGLGLATGTAVRWHMLPGRDLPQATRVTLLVTISFLAAWGVLTALSVTVFLPPASALHVQTRLIAAGVCGVALLVVLSRLSPWVHTHLWSRVTWPRLRTQFHILMLTSCDCVAAALTLYVFLPSAEGLGFPSFLPVFMLASGVGLISGIPGGVGPFETLLIMLLPDLPPDRLAASILCYRAVYYALPAVIATGALLLTQRRDAKVAAVPTTPAADFIAPWMQRQIQTQLRQIAWPRAESLLIHQGTHGLVQTRQGQNWLAAPIGSTLICLFDPAPAPVSRQLLSDVVTLSHRLHHRPCLYKIGPRSAAAARQAGWAVWPFAEEFWLRPTDELLAATARSGVRRKLRQAAKAGVCVTHHPPSDPCNPPPHTALRAIHMAWLQRHQTERGFSMGRYAPAYLDYQHVYVAHHCGQPVAWISFHAGQNERTLDLVRHGPDLPPGTMQTLVMAALRDAAADGIGRVSLAAVPLAGFGMGRTVAARLLPILRKDPAPGLRQFKAGFAQYQTPLYIAAPTRLALARAALAVLRAVHFPPGLARGPDASPKGFQTLSHEDSEKLAFDVS